MKFFVYHNEVYATRDPGRAEMYYLGTNGSNEPWLWVWHVIPTEPARSIWNEYLKEANSGRSA